MHIAVVGAGPAGLCAARHITARGNGFTCVLYEMTSNIGGAWVYTENTGKDKYGLPIGSVMYKNLRTNLPTENMEFCGFPFVNLKSFVTHPEVRQYLEDYANHYNLIKHIKFLHYVTNITLKNEKWQVMSTNLPTDATMSEEFDAVVICNGHNSIPHMGDIPSISEFEGEVLHSHNFRTPEPFSNKRVLVIGGGPSGIDITFDVAKFAAKVYFSHKNKMQLNAFPGNVEHVPLVASVMKDGVALIDGKTLKHLDVILLCTGYKFSLPFLTQECGISVIDNKFVYPLHEHVININHPTMGFIGIPFRTLQFPLYDYQVIFFIKTLTGEVELPTRENMMDDLKKEILQKEENGVAVKNYHDIGNRMRSYIENLADIAQLERPPPVLFDIYYETKHLREIKLASYREVVFCVLDDNNYRMTDLETNDLSSPAKQESKEGTLAAI